MGQRSSQLTASCWVLGTEKALPFLLETPHMPMKTEKNMIFQQLLLPMAGISLPQTSLHLFCQSKHQELEQGQGTQQLPRQGGTAGICCLLMAHSRLHSHGKLNGRLKKPSPWHKLNRKYHHASKPTLLHEDQKKPSRAAVAKAYPGLKILDPIEKRKILQYGEVVYFL